MLIKQIKILLNFNVHSVMNNIIMMNWVNNVLKEILLIVEYTKQKKMNVKFVKINII